MVAFDGFQSFASSAFVFFAELEVAGSASTVPSRFLLTLPLLQLLVLLLLVPALLLLLLLVLMLLLLLLLLGCWVERG